MEKEEKIMQPGRPKITIIINKYRQTTAFLIKLYIWKRFNFRNITSFFINEINRKGLKGGVKRLMLIKDVVYVTNSKKERV